MTPLFLACLGAAILLSLFFSTLTYSLRGISRARLGEYLDERGKSRLMDPLMDRAQDLTFITAVLRLLSNMLILLGFLSLFEVEGWSMWKQYLGAIFSTLLITLFCSVVIPHATARYSGHRIVGRFANFLILVHWLLLPVTKIMHLGDELMRRLVGASKEPEPQIIEQEILSVIEEGEKEGVVDEQEREMIESVIEFRDTQVGQIMTARPEIVALDVGDSLAEVTRTLEESGHSRIPVYEKTIDHVVGILYARDLLKHLGQPPEKFELRGALRPAIFVPETKPLRDLLQDFRLQKVHIALVLDEYGGTAGLVSIEDILEELVGEISDEHEPAEPAMLKRIDDTTAEADGRIYIDELNRLLGLSLPEDAGYDTLGGFISNTLGKIPQTGTVFEQNRAKFTILDAEPQKVNRVKIELQLEPTPEPQEAHSGK